MSNVLIGFTLNDELTDGVIEELEAGAWLDPYFVSHGARFIVSVYDHDFVLDKYMVRIMDIEGAEIYIPMYLSDVPIDESIADYLASYIEDIIRLELDMNGRIQ